MPCNAPIYATALQVIQLQDLEKDRDAEILFDFMRDQIAGVGVPECADEILHWVRNRLTANPEITSRELERLSPF